MTMTAAEREVAHSKLDAILDMMTQAKSTGEGGLKFSFNAGSFTGAKVFWTDCYKPQKKMGGGK